MPKRIEPVDILVGQRVRAYRLARHMSQSALADQVGVTFQQIQKYEKGTNRLGSSRLQKVATVLGVGIAKFFAEENGENEPGQDAFTEMLTRPYAARLLQAFGGIDKAKLRLSLVRLAETLSERSE